MSTLTMPTIKLSETEIMLARDCGLLEQLNALVALHNDTLPLTPSFKTNVPVLTCQIDHRHGDAAKEEYAVSVISARMLHSVAYQTLKLGYLIRAYIHGLAAADPYSPFGTTRSLIELVATVWHMTDRLKDAEATVTDRYQRAETFDRILIQFLWGNRCEVLRTLIESERGDPDPVQPPNIYDEQDNTDFTVTNVVTCIQRAAKKDERLRDIETDYKRLCEFVHHNAYSNLLITNVDPIAPLMEIEGYGRQAMRRAVRHTLRDFSYYAHLLPRFEQEWPTTFWKQDRLQTWSPHEAAEFKAMKLQQYMFRRGLVSTSAGRNEPCPCGSRKKWKKCCGRPKRIGM
jgi:hypothetical protein